MRILFLSAAVGILSLLSACAHLTKQTDLVERRSTKTIAKAIDGIWRSDGYGFVFEINNGQVTGYDATQDICVPFGDETFPVHDVYGEYQISSDKKTMLFYETAEIYPYKYNKIVALPLPCEQPASNTPISNFDAFTSFFNEHYAFFELYKIDWKATTKAAREQVTAQTTEAELFEIFKALLEPIRDAHVNIHANLENGPVRWNANPEKMARYIEARAESQSITTSESAAKFYNEYWLENVRKDILNGKGLMVANNRIQYGMASKTVGYIAILNEGRFTDENFDTDIAALDYAMDGLMTLLEDNLAEALIVDLSVNFGGRGKISRAIASRFATSETDIYSKYANDSADKITSTYTIKPHPGPRFLGQVYLVTSNTTLSAGEELTLALRSLENITHIGEVTRGALSDKLSKSLPNGWEITLSNEVYLDMNGVIWEGRGIEPERSNLVFAPKRPLESHKRLIKSLIALN